MVVCYLLAGCSLDALRLLVASCLVVGWWVVSWLVVGGWLVVGCYLLLVD